jgi:hypothetical protein
VFPKQNNITHYPEILFPKQNNIHSHGVKWSQMESSGVKWSQVESWSHGVSCFPLASAKYMAPCEPILFVWRSSVINTWWLNEDETDDNQVMSMYYHVSLQCISQMSSSFIFDLVQCEIKHSKCLWYRWIYNWWVKISAHLVSL